MSYEAHQPARGSRVDRVMYRDACRVAVTLGTGDGRDLDADPEPRAERDVTYPNDPRAGRGRGPGEGRGALDPRHHQRGVRPATLVRRVRVEDREPVEEGARREGHGDL